MRDFPSCFNESGVQVADSSSSSSSSSLLTGGGRSTQNLVTSVYHCQLQGGFPCFITITWTKSLMGQAGVSVCIQNSNNQTLLCKFDVKPWLFSKRKGFRSLGIGGSISTVIDIYWDFSSAKFASSSPEPLSGFYLAIGFDQELVLLLGDLEKEVHKKIMKNIPNSISSYTNNAVFVAKREHIFGKKSYTSKAQFCDKGRIHDIQIEYCDAAAAETADDPSLVIRIDSKAVMQVKRLKWKFRGNTTILVDGLPVEVYWDVHSWLFGGSVIGGGGGGGNGGNAVFLFQTTTSAASSGGGDSISADKLMLSGRSLPPGASVINWSGSASRTHLGFSLILYAWKNE